MKSHIHKSLLQGIRELHIKILQSNNVTEIASYLQQILDKVIEVPAEYNEKVRSRYFNHDSKTNIVSLLKTDIKSIVEGAYSRVEIVKHRAALDIAWLKGIFTEPPASDTAADSAT